MRLTLALLGLSLVACRGGGGNGDDVVTPDAPGGVVHIQDVQNDSMPSGTAVTLQGVVVTAIDTFGAKTGDMWVEEPGGGEFSGVKVFGAPLDQVATLQVGDIVTISNAEKNEFACSGTICGGGVFDPGQSITEIQGAGGGQMTITKTGTGTVPTPDTVDAAAIDALDLDGRNAEWEKWEGVLINVTNARQLNVAAPFGGGAEDQQEFRITGGLNVETVLAAFPVSAALGTCYEGIVGIGDYFFDYLLLPRADTAFTAGGTGCPVQTTATIADIQAGNVTGDVLVTDVFVTGLHSNKRRYWIASSLTAAPNEGVFVFGSAVLDPSIVGKKVNLSATVSEFNDDDMGGTLTELNNPGLDIQADAAGTVVPVTNMTAVQLLDAGTAPTFESVAVTLTNVNITALGSAGNGFIASATQNGTTFGVATDILHLVTGDLGCYSSITGFWTNLQAAATSATTKPNAFGFIPMTLGTKNGTCN